MENVGSRVIVEHTRDPDASHPHFHAGQPAPPSKRLGVDFGWGGSADKAEKYKSVGPKHHFKYKQSQV
jgi:hypothetical protein